MMDFTYTLVSKIEGSCEEAETLNYSKMQHILAHNLFMI